MSALVPAASALLTTQLAVLPERGYAADARASSTRRIYRAKFRAFEAWCAARRLDVMPAHPATIVLYVTDRANAGCCVKTIEAPPRPSRSCTAKAGTPGEPPMPSASS